MALSERERQVLLKVAREAIASKLEGREEMLPEPDTENLKAKNGAFVTIKIDNNLRGCIGIFEGRADLIHTVFEMARAAAFSDPRFPPLSEKEFEKISIEISVLSPITPIDSPEKVEVGKHGLVVSRGFHRGVLLPQVPVEYGWDREEFLRHTCLKAGLPPDAWKEPDTRLEVFTAEVFGEE